jgi:hypothetical protein
MSPNGNIGVHDTVADPEVAGAHIARVGSFAVVGQVGL